MRTRRQKCYPLVVDGTQVGVYPDHGLRPEYVVGFILAESVYGDPRSNRQPRANRDWPHECV